MIEYSYISEKGSRMLNEDSVGCFSKGHNHCFVLCDGLGGHGMGEVASQLVTSVFKEQFLNNKIIKTFLPESFVVAQAKLIEDQAKKAAENKMKTTCVSMITDEKSLYVGFIGDSRLYAFNKNGIVFRTLDHSIPQTLVLLNELKEDEIRFHPERNIVLKVMGTEWEKHLFELLPKKKIRKFQAFLLCSDGFWELIHEKDMCSTLSSSNSPEEWLIKMAEIVRKAGADRDMDNYSAIAVWNL